MLPPDFVRLSSLYGIAISLLMLLEPYLGSFFIYFLLSDGESPRLVKNAENVGNETSVFNLDRKYIGYPAISDTLLLQIFIFFQLILMCPVEILFKRDHKLNDKNFFFNLMDQIAISGHWVINVISFGNMKWCSKLVVTYQSVQPSNNDDLCIFLCKVF